MASFHRYELPTYNRGKTLRIDNNDIHLYDTVFLAWWEWLGEKEVLTPWGRGQTGLAQVSEAAGPLEVELVLGEHKGMCLKFGSVICEEENIVHVSHLLVKHWEKKVLQNHNQGKSKTERSLRKCPVSCVRILSHGVKAHPKVDSGILPTI